MSKPLSPRRRPARENTHPYVDFRRSLPLHNRWPHHLKLSKTQTASASSAPTPTVSPAMTAPAEPATMTTTTGPVFATTIPNKAMPQGKSQPGMTWIPGGEFSMGAQDPPDMEHDHTGMKATEDSRPVHRVYVDGFWMDKTDVTNAEFAKFVAATHYITEAERTPKAEDFPGAPPENLVAGAVVFSPPDQPVPLNNQLQWWSYVKGANWRHPSGPDSDIKGKENYPVVDVSYDDAQAYAKWAGNVSPPKRSGSSPLAVASPASRLFGATLPAKRQIHGKHLPGPLPQQEHGRRWICSDLTRYKVSAQRLRPLRHGRQRLAMDLRLVPSRLLPKTRCLRHCHPQPNRPRRLLRSRRTRSIQAGHARRILPLHRSVLLSLYGRNSRQRRGVNRH